MRAILLPSNHKETRADPGTLLGGGGLRVIPPTLCVMDRLAAFVPWRDRQCLEQAIWVAQSHAIDWDDLRSWATQEGMSEADWRSFQSHASAQDG